MKVSTVSPQFWLALFWLLHFRLCYFPVMPKSGYCIFWLLYFLVRAFSGYAIFRLCQKTVLLHFPLCHLHSPLNDHVMKMKMLLIFISQSAMYVRSTFLSQLKSQVPFAFNNEYNEPNPKPFFSRFATDCHFSLVLHARACAS
jgi:hypothetical protein